MVVIFVTELGQDGQDLGRQLTALWAGDHGGG